MLEALDSAPGHGRTWVRGPTWTMVRVPAWSAAAAWKANAPLPCIALRGAPTGCIVAAGTHVPPQTAGVRIVARTSAPGTGVLCGASPARKRTNADGTRPGRRRPCMTTSASDAAGPSGRPPKRSAFAGTGAPVLPRIRVMSREPASCATSRSPSAASTTGILVLERAQSGRATTPATDRPASAVTAVGLWSISRGVHGTVPGAVPLRSAGATRAR